MDDNEIFKLFSLPFDFFIWLNNEKIEHLLDEITQPILEKRSGNKIRDSYKSKLMTCYKIILLNLLSVHKHRAAECLAVPRNRNDIQPKNRYHLLDLISVGSFNEAYDMLCDGYIEVLAVGEQGLGKKKGRRTRIIATPKLTALFDQIFPEEIVFFERHPNEEIIIKKSNKYDKGGEILEYDDTEETVRQRESLQQINKVLQSHWYDLWLTDKEFEFLRKRMKRRHEEDTKKHFFINYTNRRLQRKYNNNSFEKGGRFYGGWWQSIPKEYRKYIHIDGKSAVEIDYSNMHPFILYSSKGEHLKSDAYAIDGIKKRSTGKLAFNLLLNKESFRKPQKYDPSEWGGLEWRNLKCLVLDHHNAIKECFGTGAGLGLQYIDSQIAEKVLLHFSKSNYPCLPLHDSFIVHHALEDELIQVMKEAYKEVLGDWEINVDVDDYFQLYTESYVKRLSDTNREVPDDIDEALDLTGDYKEYNRRLQLWYS